LLGERLRSALEHTLSASPEARPPSAVSTINFQLSTLNPARYRSLPRRAPPAYAGLRSRVLRDTLSSSPTPISENSSDDPP
jgi:hypothetical protein